MSKPKHWYHVFYHLEDDLGTDAPPQSVFVIATDPMDAKEQVKKDEPDAYFVKILPLSRPVGNTTP